MAEALAVISGIAGLLSISSEVCRKVTLFVLSTKRAGKSEKDLQKELLCFSRALARVQNVLLDNLEFSPEVLRSDSAIGDCRAVLQELETIYSYQTSANRLRRLTWTKKPLGGPHSSLDLEKLRKCRVLLEQWKPLPERDSTHHSNIGKTTLYNGVNETGAIETPIINQHSEILQWLSPIDPRDKHYELRRRRVKGIEARIINIDVFSRWSSQGEGPKALWCHGLPGTGKSMITSFVIDHLGEGSLANDSGIAYYYFDYKSQQPLSDVVAVLVKQFCLLKATIPYAVLNLFERGADDEQRPSLGSFLKVLQLLSTQFKQSYIILDAIDEHESFTKREMQQLLQGLKGSSSQLFVTSRRKTSDISELLSSCSEAVEIRATKEDVSCYIKDRIAQSPALNYLDQQLKEHVVSVLVKSSRMSLNSTPVETMITFDKVNREGSLREAAVRDERGHYNFLFAVLQIDWFLGQFTTERDVKAALRRIPPGFNGTLGEASQRLLDLQSTTNRALANGTLMWVLYAKRPLSMRELCQALAISTDGRGLNERALPTPIVIKQACAGLITVDESSSTVSLVHYSVYEHLRKSRGKLFPQGPRRLALACVSYLMHESFETTNLSDDKSIDTFRSHPFLDYAAHTWTSHCRDRNADDAVIMQELDESAKTEYLHEKSEMVRQINQTTLKLLEDYKSKLTSLPPIEPPSFKSSALVPVLNRSTEGLTSLHLAARFGLFDEVSQLLANGDIDPSVTYGMKRMERNNTAKPLGVTPLHEAAWVGAVKVADLLIKHGADPLCVDEHLRAPIHYAAGCGRNGMLKLLLATNKYESPDLKDENGQTPLHLAASAGYAKIIQMLVTHGAVVDMVDPKGRTALHLAAENGHSAVCASLLAAGSDLLVRDNHGLTPLHSATKSGYELVVRTLLGRKADLSLTAADSLTPLHYATLGGSQSLVEMLLTNGANINARDGNGETPLFKAVRQGDHDMAKLLLNRGADFDMRNFEGCSVSSYAEREGQETMVSMLRQYGA